MSQSSNAPQTPEEPTDIALSVPTDQAIKTGQSQRPPTGGSPHRDLHQIIVRAREEIHHLRERLTQLEADATVLVRERDEAQQRFADLEHQFLETVDVAAEARIRRIADELDPIPQRVPPLLEPVGEALARWVERQQREREAYLLHLLEQAEQQAERLHQEMMKERAGLEAEKEKMAQQRREFDAQMESRRAALRHRWLARTWLTATVMFLLLPALEWYLLSHGASVTSAIIISTAICLVLVILVGLVRARRRSDRPATPTPPK